MMLMNINTVYKFFSTASIFRYVREIIKVVKKMHSLKFDSLADQVDRTSHLGFVKYSFA